MELAHPLPALGKEDCADFFKCQTIRKKAGWRLLPTTEKLPTQGRELEAQTLFAQIQHICLVCKGWKRNQPCRNTGFVKLRLLLRTLSQKKKKMCPQIFKNCLKMTIQTDHVQILTPPPAGMRGDGTRSQGLSRCFSIALLIRALPEPLAGCVPKSHHHPFGLTLLHGCAPSSPGCPVLGPSPAPWPHGSCRAPPAASRAFRAEEQSRFVLLSRAGRVKSELVCHPQRARGQQKAGEPGSANTGAFRLAASPWGMARISHE